MNAIISRGDKTAHVQLPVERKQLAGALSYLGANHTSDYDLRYNEENKDGLKVSLECFGVVENAIAKALPVGFRFHTLNETLTLMGNLPYQNRREVENTIKVDGLESYEQFNRMLTEAYPQSVTTKYYCPLTIQVDHIEFELCRRSHLRIRLPPWSEISNGGAKGQRGIANHYRLQPSFRKWRGLAQLQSKSHG